MFIAEIGINHNGSVDTAKRMILEAKDAGVSIVKFQKRDPEVCIPDAQKHLVKDTLFGTMEYIEYKRLLEFGKPEYDEIDEFCKNLGVHWTASVWDENSIEFIKQYDVPFIKIPSACITDLRLLYKANQTGKPIIIGTGMSDEFQIATAVHMLRTCLFGILHCNSSYPCAFDQVNLNYINKLKFKYPQYAIGYSGHECGILPTVLAKSVGAEIIERHITLDKCQKGSDHKASLDMLELKELMTTLNRVDAIMGQDKKIIYPEETEMRAKLRRY